MHKWSSLEGEENKERLHKQYSLLLHPFHTNWHEYSYPTSNNYKSKEKIWKVYKIYKHIPVEVIAVIFQCCRLQQKESMMLSTKEYLDGGQRAITSQLLALLS